MLTEDTRYNILCRRESKEIIEDIGILGYQTVFRPTNTKKKLLSLLHKIVVLFSEQEITKNQTTGGNYMVVSRLRTMIRHIII